MQPGYWITEDTRTFMSRGYLLPGQTVEQRIRQIAEAAERYLDWPGFAYRMEQYILKGWVSLASPVWSNFGTNRGLPISCNGSFVEDSMESILMTAAEIGMMTKHGAGTSAYIGTLRERGASISGGGASNGPVHFMELFQTHVNIVSQSNVRRGNAAIYLDIRHADIGEFLDCREEGHPIQHLSLGVCIDDAWMEEMIAGDREKRKLWARILKKRFETGYPYLFFSDRVNNEAPAWYRDKHLRIWASNLCTEICQPANEQWSFVCCLSSLNLLHYDAWKDTTLVEDMVAFLDAVIEEYIQKTRDIPLMEKAHAFARDNRAIGLGVLGWHSYLQSINVPFDSTTASALNREIWKEIDKRTRSASQQLAAVYGEAPVCEGYGYRNATRLAVAPTTSSSFILDKVSQGIEPENSNYYTKDLAKGKFTYKNPYLQKLLAEKGRDDAETWRSILLAGGSVQHLDFLNDHEKAVFKTFGEIDPVAIVEQAATRQQYIDQAQSLNLMIHPETPLKDVNELMILGWRMGLKTYYYQRSTNPAQEYVRSLMSCVSCEA